MYLPVNLLPSPSHKLKVAIEKKHALGDHESSFTYFTTIFYLQDIPIHRIVEKRWVKIYWITKCTTTGYSFLMFSSLLKKWAKKGRIK